MKNTALIINVDDTAAARYLKTKILKLAGYEVIEADKGSDALRLIRERKPDLALLDVKLPDMSGLEVCRKLKTNRATAGIPVVQISATHVSESDREAGFQHGADIYLTEPVEPLELTTVVATLLRLRAAESSRFDSEERFKAVVNQATAGIAQTDLSGRYVQANQRYCDMTGQSAENLEQTDIFSHLYAEDITLFRNQFNCLVRDGISFESEKCYLRPDGSGVWINNSVALVRDGAGNPRGTIIVAIDVTERKRKERSERLLVELTDQLAELLETETTLQKAANTLVPAWADWCRLTLSNEFTVEAGNSNFAIPTPSDKRPTVIPECARAESEKIIPSDKSTSQQVNPRVRSAIYVPIVLRQYVGDLLLVLGDSSAYDEADLACAVEIAHRIAIALENVGLYSALAKEAKRKDDFLATLAHELRNPLAPLRNALRIIENMTKDAAPAVCEARHLMERQVVQLVRLVDDLLDVSRINTGKIDLRLQPIVLASAIGEALEVAAPSIKAKHNLVIEAPPPDIWINGDSARVEQILINLLDNASKYTPIGGRIALTWERRDSDIAISVTDNGIGIAPELLPDVFNMFVQADESMEKSKGGLGIGLTLVKQLMELHAGRVEASSPGLGKGSCFTVIFKSIEAPSAAFPADFMLKEQKGSQPSPRRKILVVDDNIDSAESLAMIFRMMGHIVVTAHNGSDALRTAAEQPPPDIVFLDIGLPGMSGYDVARELRAKPGLNRVLLIALSGYGTSQDQRRSHLAGFDRHLIKPADLAVLEAIVGRCEFPTAPESDAYREL